MFFSADSDPFTVRTRAMSMLNGCSLDESTRAELSGETASMEAKLAEHPIRFNFNSSPSIEDIERSLYAYDEVYGEYPRLVVLDNLTDVYTDAEDDSLEPLMDYLHTMARGTQACVLGLHHVTGEYNNRDKPIPLNGVKNQIHKKPEMVLTAFKRNDGMKDYMCISTVKNRTGKDDATGQTYVELVCDLSRMSITEET